MDSIQTQGSTGATTATSAPPTPIPDAGIEYDGGLIVQVTAYWLLALIIVFSVFRFMPKLESHQPQPT